MDASSANQGFIEPLVDSDIDIGQAQETGDGAGSDYDSSMSETGSAFGSAFGSVTSSVVTHEFQHGRRYHAFQRGRYPIPNDDLEYQREALRHEMSKELIDGRLYLAPIGNHPQKIIDLGTGFGEWAFEMAEIFPSAQVIGTDLSSIQPAWVPPNLQFSIDDIEAPWLHGDGFDFVHLRYVNCVLRNNEEMLRKVLRHLKPGGWVEIVDLSYAIFCDDGTMPDDWPSFLAFKVIEHVFRDKYHFDVDYLDGLAAMLMRLGFANIERRDFKVPIGEWARDVRMRVLGGLQREILDSLVAAQASRSFPEAGMEPDEAERFAASAREALADRRVHTYKPFHFVWAQRPLE